MKRKYKSEDDTRIKIISQLNCDENTVQEYIDTLSEEELLYGYGFFLGHGEVKDACSVKKIDLLNILKTNDEAAKQYENQGGKIIRDIKTDEFYIDNTSNRYLVETYYRKKAQDNIRDFLHNENNIINAFSNTRKRMFLEDGFQLSVQAGEIYYSLPKENLADGTYESVEIGYPSHIEPLLIDFMECDPYEIVDPTKTIYPYVPMSVLEKVIMKHGTII